MNGLKPVENFRCKEGTLALEKYPCSFCVLNAKMGRGKPAMLHFVVF